MGGDFPPFFGIAPEIAKKPFWIAEKL